MDNVKYLEDNIEQVKEFIRDTEDRMAVGEVMLGAQLHTLKRHLNDLYQQLAKAREPELVGSL